MVPKLKMSVVATCVAFGLAVGIVGCKAREQAKPVETYESNNNTKLGVAGKFLVAFFDDWEKERFNELTSKVLDASENSHLAISLKVSPINVRNLKIISETPVSGGYDVALEIDVTDLESAYAACRINIVDAAKNGRSAPQFLFSPKMLGIERFKTMKQTWRVVDSNGKLLVDSKYQGDKTSRAQNIINYAFHALDILPFSVVTKEIGMSAADFVAGKWLFDQVKILDTNVATLELSKNISRLMIEKAFLVMELRTKNHLKERNMSNADFGPSPERKTE